MDARTIRSPSRGILCRSAMSIRNGVPGGAVKHPAPVVHSTPEASRHAAPHVPRDKLPCACRRLRAPVTVCSVHVNTGRRHPSAACWERRGSRYARSARPSALWTHRARHWRARLSWAAFPRAGPCACVCAWRWAWLVCAGARTCSRAVGETAGSLTLLPGSQSLACVYVVLQQCIQEKKPLGRPVTSCVERLRLSIVPWVSHRLVLVGLPCQRVC